MNDYAYESDNSKRKVRMAMEIGKPVYVLANYYSKQPESVLKVVLQEYHFNNGDISWCIEIDDKNLLEGDMKGIRLPSPKIGGEVTMCLSIPVKLHKRGSKLVPDFIFEFPNPLRIYHEKNLIEKGIL